MYSRLLPSLLVLFFVASCGSWDSSFPKDENPPFNAPDILAWDMAPDEQTSCMYDAHCQGKVDLAECEVAACRDGQCVAIGAPLGSYCQGNFEECLSGRCEQMQEALLCVPVAAPNGTPCAEDEWELPYKVRTCLAGECAPALECVTRLDCQEMEDEDRCNGILSCRDNFCVLDPDSVIDCSDIDAPQCQEAYCEPATGACVFKPLANNTECVDEDLCTTGDFCKDGVCISGPSLNTCSDINIPQCKVAICNPATGTCDLINGKDGSPCSDDKPCLLGDYCSKGVCVGGTTPKVCPNDPDHQCKEAYCDETTGDCLLKNLLDGTACEDGNLCTLEDECQDGQCQPGTHLACPQDEVPLCHLNSCVPETGLCEVQSLADNSPCEDGDLCTLNDRCQEGQCVSGNAHTCSQEFAGQCEEVLCVSATGLCELSNKPNGTFCDDSNPCTLNDACIEGLCQGEEILCSQDGIPPCKRRVCDPVSGDCELVNAEDGTSCDNGNLCTLNDQCLGGACVAGDEKPCSQDGLVFCQMNVCVPMTGQCEVVNKVQGTPCDNGNFCTTDDKCYDGTCEAGQAIECSQEGIGSCFVNTCNPSNGSCYPLPAEDGAPCEDGNLCTTGDVCQLGQCIPGQALDCNLEAGATGNQCKINYCVPFTGLCAVMDKQDGATCSDGNPCTLEDKCFSGFCVSGEEKKCDQGDAGQCEEYACNVLSGSCELMDKATNTPCDDSDPCTHGDFCQAGHCIPGAMICELICNDGLDNNNNGLTDCEDPDCYDTEHCPDSDGDGVVDQFDLCPGFDDKIDVNKNGKPDACELDIVTLLAPAMNARPQYYNFRVEVFVAKVGITDTPGATQGLSVKARYRDGSSSQMKNLNLTFKQDHEEGEIWHGVIPAADLISMPMVMLDILASYRPQGVDMDYDFEGVVSFADSPSNVAPFLFMVNNPDTSNWSFEEDWTGYAHPHDFQLLTNHITATRTDISAADGIYSAQITWTSQDNQDLRALYIIPIPEDSTLLWFSVQVLDNDQAGRARPFVTFFDQGMKQIGNPVYNSTYTVDSPNWQDITQLAAVPAGAAFVETAMRFYDVPADWEGSATLLIDKWDVVLF